MRKRNRLLDVCKSKMNSDLQSESIVYELLNYYELYDLEHGTIYGKVYKMLYVDVREYKLQEVANKNYITIYTVNKYVKRYNKLAQKMILRGFKEFIQNR